MYGAQSLSTKYASTQLLVATGALELGKTNAQALDADSGSGSDCFFGLVS